MQFVEQPTQLAFKHNLFNKSSTEPNPRKALNWSGCLYFLDHEVGRGRHLAGGVEAKSRDDVGEGDLVDDHLRARKKGGSIRPVRTVDTIWGDEALTG